MLLYAAVLCGTELAYGATGGGPYAARPWVGPYPIAQRTSYAKPSTELGYAATRCARMLYAPTPCPVPRKGVAVSAYAVCGTDVVYAPTRICYAVCGTERGYGATSRASGEGGKT
eukprot:2332335-Rhodomonas_salina.2